MKAHVIPKLQFSLAPKSKLQNIAKKKEKIKKYLGQNYGSSFSKSVPKFDKY